MAEASTLLADARPAAAAASLARPGYWRAVARRLGRDPITVAVTFMLLAIILMAICAPLVAPLDPYAGGVLSRLKPIGSEHPSHSSISPASSRAIASRILPSRNVSRSCSRSWVE